MKNIPLPSKQDFLTQMISSSDKFIKNLRWRVFFFLYPSEPRERKETFGFNSTNPAPTGITELKEFENKMYELTRDIKFKPHNNQFQTKLKEDTAKVKSDSKMYIAADKTTNYYKVDKDEYDQLLQKHINKDYKKTEMEAVKEVTKVDKEIVTNLDIEDRVYSTTAKQAFVTLKDHKPNFINNPSCRLLNPTKNELVGLFMLHKLKQLNLNQGIYRDDALIACQLRPRQVELKKKEICRIFREHNLSITIEANLKVVNFLDVTLDLNTETYKPYMKPNNRILYINKQSNHPPSII